MWRIKASAQGRRTVKTKKMGNSAVAKFLHFSDGLECLTFTSQSSWEPYVSVLVVSPGETTLSFSCILSASFLSLTQLGSKESLMIHDSLSARSPTFSMTGFDFIH